MPATLANTIWVPLFVYRCDTFSALLSFAVGFLAECGVFHLYTRRLLSWAVIVRRLAWANVASYATGHLVLIFVPLDIHKDSLRDTALAFFIAYLITLPVEFCVLRSLLPANRGLILRAVVTSNFFSYAILFFGYIVWFAGWHFLVRRWTGGV